jgi:hypothetical protein
MLHHIATISVCYGGHFKSKMTAKIQKSSNLGEIWYYYRSDDLFCVKFQKDPLIGVNLTFFAPWLPWQRPPFEFVQPLKSCHTLRWIFLQNFMKFEERNPNFFLIDIYRE